MANPTGKYFCILPHSHLNLTARGHTIACCNYSWRASPAFKTENGYSIPKHQDSPIKEIFNNHAEWEQLRHNSLNDIPSPGCAKCYKYEESGSESHRTWANSRFSNIEVTEDNHTLKSFELKLGAKCNLACRSCSSRNSNKLLKEDSFANFGNVDKEWMRKTQSESDWIYDDVFWNGLHEVSHDLEYIQFTGGEPLLIQEHYDYLKWLSDHDIRPEIAYVTNATIVLTEKMKQIWNEFNSITISFSIDATDELEEYMRTGSVWEQQQRNIKEYSEYFNERNELHGASHGYAISTTVSILNVYSIEKMIDYLISLNNPDMIDYWTINMVTSPEWLNVANIPRSVKPIIKDRLYKVINRNDISEMIRSNLKLIIDCIDDNIDTTSTAGGEFIQRLKLQEQNHFLANKKMINYKEIEPEWWKLLTEGK